MKEFFINDSLIRTMESKTDDELRNISVCRGGRYNRYTKEALAAQTVLHERSGCFLSGGSCKGEHKTVSCEKIG